MVVLVLVLVLPMARLQAAGWQNHNAYPLQVSGETEKGLVRYMADKGVSRGKALNQLVREGLYSYGYLTRPVEPLTAEQERAKLVQFWKDQQEKQPITEKARAWLEKHLPEAVVQK